MGYENTFGFEKFQPAAVPDIECDQSPKMLVSYSINYIVYKGTCRAKLTNIWLGDEIYVSPDYNFHAVGFSTNKWCTRNINVTFPMVNYGNQ